MANRRDQIERDERLRQIIREEIANFSYQQSLAGKLGISKLKLTNYSWGFAILFLFVLWGLDFIVCST